jgi:hypothetical protein
MKPTYKTFLAARVDKTGVSLLHDHRKDQARDKGKRLGTTERGLRGRWRPAPIMLAALQLHYLRWVLFDRSRLRPVRDWK